jgi:hypothetical protein
MAICLSYPVSQVDCKAELRQHSFLLPVPLFDDRIHDSLVTPDLSRRLWLQTVSSAGKSQWSRISDKEREIKESISKRPAMAAVSAAGQNVQTTGCFVT